MSLAGIAMPDGKLDRPVGGGAWEVPHSLRVKDGLLSWGCRGGPAARVTSGAGMFEDFLKLEEGSDEVILRYAQKWGVLRLCREHLAPSSHVPHRLKVLIEDDHWPCRVNEWAGRQWEPIDRWRYYSRQANAMLKIAVVLGGALPGEKPQPASRVDWESTLELFTPQIDPEAFRLLVTDKRDAMRIQGVLLERAVNEWLAMGDARVAWRWSRGRPQVDLGGDSLFSAMAVQLSLALARVDGLSICDECRRPYPARRRNAPGKPRYCPSCRNRATSRNWYRKHSGLELGGDDE